MKIIVTGMQYQCGDELALHEMMEHLELERPEVCLVRKTTHDYGVVVEVKERRRVLGMVSRFDLMDVLEVMRQKGFAAVKGRVSRVFADGGWMMVDINVATDVAAHGTDGDDEWMKWAMPDIPLMKDIPGHGDLESTVAYLDAALNCPDEFDTDTTVECMTDFLEMSRYDVSRETQVAMKKFRSLLDDSTVSSVHSMLGDLIHAINGIGSRKRQTEFEEVFYQMVLDSDEAMDMINAWYSSFAYTLTDDATMEDICRRKLSDIEKHLQTLPFDLYRSIDRKGQLLHMLLYKSIPYDRLRALMSALVLRDHLLDELETVMEFTTDEEADSENGALSTEVACRLWKKAQENQWVDENLQPLVSQNKAAILASVMSDEMNLSPRWALFEELWGITDLATKLCMAQNCQYYSSFLKKVEGVML